ncbi:manganese/zinc/iron transport system permease protein [Flexibacter flexilis DSM 6793]|uniref:Manganese/zinc/iron transport system permease protein n=1 Tax=Flexibacter flexilis DSM 6793 TaxID=927664 RepID=A0A1I1HB87_9BACT|nr:metal ABC transporter permease [Flexibacter flexilis]SFC19248.1 manganese/zinc/iron transport system permease protein [Flexibacter flexilis DSM 6793]
MEAFYIMLAGSLVAVSCALLGCFLVLRRMAMIGDAISHAILPGIVAAFLLSGHRDSITMLLGAGLIGIFSTFLIEFFHNTAKLQTDAAIGVTFTWLFAAGVILISVFAGQIDLDQDCVLYGEIAYIPLDLWWLDPQTHMGPRVVWVMAGLLALIIAFVYFFYKQLFITTFDPAYAVAMGISATLWHYLLMGAVSLTTVVAFEAVGAILVVALLVVPAASAYLLTESLPKMLWLAAFFGVVSAVGGYYLAVWIDGSIAGAMSVVAGLCFVAAFGLSKLQRQQATQAQVA